MSISQFSSEPLGVATFETQLAILIDADNASIAYLDEMMSEIAMLGRASARRAYGDWTKPQLASWKNVLLSHSILPIQQFAYTTRQNPPNRPV